MNLVIDILETGRSRTAAARLTGTCGRADREPVEAFAEECLSGDCDLAVLDLSGLGGISEDVADAVAAFARRLEDRGGRLVLVDPNVVVSWVLDRHAGEGGLATSPDLATALGQDEDAEPEAPAAADVVPAPRRGRPDRTILSTLTAALDRKPSPALWSDVVGAALTRAGLAAECRLCLADGGDLHLPGADGRTIPADGWMGSHLAAAAVPLETGELDGGGLTAEERAYLKWSGADVHLPIVDDGRLLGLLSVTSGRDRGLAGYRAGEVLALDLVAHILAVRLTAARNAVDGADEPGVSLLEPAV